MSTVITVENLGKRYTLRHQQREQYTALRDIITNGVASLGKKLIHPFRRTLIPHPSSLVPTSEDFWALKDVSFEVKQGERIGIIGRNGAGKSTLLKILSRITEPTTGRVRIRGRVASLLEVGTGFHPELTGRENIYLNGAILGMDRAEIKMKFDEIVDFSEIEKFLDTPVKRYSSGMYVRLAFAVAAHLEPEILIVDEVLAVGDAQFQKKCLGKMEDIGKEGRTVLFVSHNMGAISRLCQRSVLLSSGMIVADGEIADVIPSYLNSASSIIKTLTMVQNKPEKLHQILEVSVCQANGNQISGPLKVDEPFTIHLCCRLSSPLPCGYAVLELKNQSGEYVLFTDSRDNPQSATYQKPGVVSVVIDFPAPQLVPGNYYISAYIAQEMVGTVDACVDAIILQIEDMQGVRTNRPGYIYLPLMWQLANGEV
jgi:lipopolysaccharide transport system ATP-binding protein